LSYIAPNYEISLDWNDDCIIYNIKLFTNYFGGTDSYISVIQINNKNESY